MATLNAPLTLSEMAAAGVSPAIVVAGGEFYLQNAQVFDAFARLLGFRFSRIGGSGSKTLHFGNASAWASYTLETLNSETEAPPDVTPDLSSDSVTVGRHGLGVTETFDARIFMTDQALQATGLGSLMMGAPAAVYSKMASLLGSAQAGISAAIGQTTTELSLDNLFAAFAQFEQTFIADPRMQVADPVLSVHPVQVSQVKASARMEPGLQATGESVNIQGINNSQIVQNWGGFGVTLFRNSRVTTASSAYQGAMFSPGSVIIGVGAVERLTEVLVDGARYMLFPDIGTLVQVLTDQNNQALMKAQVQAWLGASMGATNVGSQTRLISKVA